MRYLFRPEIEGLLNDAGLKLVDSFEWMTGNTARAQHVGSLLRMPGMTETQF